MLSQVLWLLFWPVFILICIYTIRFFVKKYEKNNLPDSNNNNAFS